jgi:hypothetical protein
MVVNLFLLQKCQRCALDQSDELKYYGLYRGIVLGNDSAETSKLGRLKIEVYPMLIGKDTALELKRTHESLVIEGIATADLPWATPAMPLFSGSGIGYGAFAIPKVGSHVWVFFEGGDIYQPVYFAEAISGLVGLPSERLVDYPNSIVFKTQNGVVISIDDKLGNESISLVHPTGSKISIDKDGDINIDGVNINITSSGSTNVTASGNVVVQGSEVNINP